MTNKQVQMINRLRQGLEVFNFGKGEYEIKEYEVEEVEGTEIISFYAIVGMKNDEGTLAARFCRYVVHVFVGKRGGCSYYGKGRTRKQFNIFKESLLTVALNKK